MSESKQPPHLPDVVDEAGNTPNWVPLLGLGLLCMVALAIAAQQAMGPKDAQAGSGADGGVVAEGAEKPTAAAAPVPTRAPAPTPAAQQ